MLSRAVTPAYPIETARLRLRPIDPVDDLEALHAYQSLPEVCWYIPREPRTRQDIARRLAEPGMGRSTATGPGQEITLAIEVTETGLVVGDVMLAWTDETNAEIGYVIHPDHQGHGYATEASAALLTLAFDADQGLGVHRVTARVDQRNPASAAVLRKLGMRLEATLTENEWFKGRWSSEWDFAILDREWRPRACRYPRPEGS